MTTETQKTFVDSVGYEIAVGDTVIVTKVGFSDWTPEGLNGGQVTELDSAAWLRSDGHVSIQFSNGQTFCYMPNQLIKVMV